MDNALLVCQRKGLRHVQQDLHLIKFREGLTTHFSEKSMILHVFALLVIVVTVIAFLADGLNDVRRGRQQLL